MVINREENKINGFTLIEFIGALAIMTIILTMLTPNLFKRVAETNIRNEKQMLKSFEKAFKDNVLRNRRIPDHTGWAQILSDELALPIEQVTNVFQIPRIFLIDPLFRVGPILSQLPYSQGTNGSLLPQNPRVMIISSLSVPLPEQSGISQNFNQIWNTPDGQIPSVWQGAYNGKPESLIVQRIELDSLFKFVIVNNLSSNLWAKVKIDEHPPVYIPPLTEGIAGFFFRDTIFSFYDTNGNIAVQATLTDDYSFVFENGVWRGQILDGKDKANAQFQFVANQFLNAPRYSGATHGAKQVNVLEFFCEYARAYTVWSLENFISTNGKGEQYPAEEQTEDYADLLMSTAGYLIGSQGKGN
ncbi:MAG: prepilin-type N-terminal cleavage/methylation domain-containing protein [Verrucomicrobiae bacterium]|nr:prepilin-type N-terminal cleavage/methylation domain-containing protein [Verrucomicrobiae bacterium]